MTSILAPLHDARLAHRRFGMALPLLTPCAVARLPVYRIARHFSSYPAALINATASFVTDITISSSSEIAQIPIVI